MQNIIKELQTKAMACSMSNKESRARKGAYVDAIVMIKEELRKPAVGDSLPTEEQVLQTIFDCVFIRGIELEDYKQNFTNEQSGLYNALVKLFKNESI